MSIFKAKKGAVGQKLSGIVEEFDGVSQSSILVYFVISVGESFCPIVDRQAHNVLDCALVGLLFERKLSGLEDLRHGAGNPAFMVLWVGGLVERLERF